MVRVRGVYRQYGATNLSELRIDVTKDWEGYQIKNVADPIAPQDAATKNYVDTELTDKITDKIENEISTLAIIYGCL